MLFVEIPKNVLYSHIAISGDRLTTYNETVMDVTIFNKTGVMSWACANDKMMVVKHLIGLGLDIQEIIDCNDVQALRLSCNWGYLHIVKYLVNLGIPLNDIIHCRNLFILACQRGHIDIVKYLFGLGVTFDDIHRCPITLIKLCEKGQLDILRYIYDDSPLDKYHKYTSARIIGWAFINNHENMVEYLLTNYPYQFDLRNNYLVQWVWEEFY